MSDLIERQAAIDAIVIVDGMKPADRIIAVNALMDLPSAQPEIIRCKDCKYFYSSRDECEKSPLHQCVSTDFYCGFAERRNE